MLLTKEEAKEKECCQPLIWYNQFGNGGVVDPIYKKCTASKCMAWRWYKCTERDGDDIHDKTCIGYCGLAGKVE